jgi:hypothetical protein
MVYYTFITFIFSNLADSVGRSAPMDDLNIFRRRHRDNGTNLRYRGHIKVFGLSGLTRWKSIPPIRCENLMLLCGTTIKNHQRLDS